MIFTNVFLQNHERLFNISSNQRRFKIKNVKSFFARALVVPNCCHTFFLEYMPKLFSIFTVIYKALCIHYFCNFYNPFFIICKEKSFFLGFILIFCLLSNIMGNMDKYNMFYFRLRRVFKKPIVLLCEQLYH